MNKKIKIFLIIILIIIFLFFLLTQIYTPIPRGYFSLINDALKEKIYFQQDQYGIVSLTDEIRISGKIHPYISTESITDGTGMDHKQVLFMINGYTDDFQTSDGSVLEIKTNSKITYQFGVLCDKNKTDLITSLSNYSTIIKDDTIPGSFNNDDERVCIVFPVKE
jgi:hypothetical protein